MTDVLEMEHDEFQRENYEDILASISEDIVIENILDQIQDSLNIETLKEKQSLFPYFETKMRDLVDKYPMETAEYPEVFASIDSALNTISKKIEDVYQFEIYYSEYIDIEVKLDYVKSLYEFFTIGIYDGLFKLTNSFINAGIDGFVNELETIDKEERKNLSYKYIQVDIDNKYTPLVYHIKEVINTLDFPIDMYAEDVFEIMIKDDEGEEISNNIAKIFIDNEWVDVVYQEPITETLIEAIHGNENLIKDIKISLIKTYKDITD